MTVVARMSLKCEERIVTGEWSTGGLNCSQTTVKGYLKIVQAFAKCFHRSPDQLGPEQIRATETCESETAGDIAPVLRNP